MDWLVRNLSGGSKSALESHWRIWNLSGESESAFESHLKVNCFGDLQSVLASSLLCTVGELGMALEKEFHHPIRSYLTRIVFAIVKYLCRQQIINFGKRGFKCTEHLSEAKIVNSQLKHLLQMMFEILR
ncbi:hypothetical protein CEXT_701161 [Caerostris extrusa]|uniref:Gamma-tubulin complex component n=1 Tax=Caerostris extrusa TaxID=172846 RepID=A0AAV4NT02_CAEEX|nr:hypothetical protein CEXT_701161 [Caerostris extrusa]